MKKINTLMPLKSLKGFNIKFIYDAPLRYIAKTT